MDDTRAGALLDLERRGWDSLCDGSGHRFYGDLMTDDAVMVLANGATMTRADVVASLADAPPWDGYDIADERVVDAGPDAATLVYRGTGHRRGGEDFVGVMTSTYVRRDGGWRLALYTQNQLPEES
jgi:Domain of unknown function (DUF4440)